VDREYIAYEQTLDIFLPLDIPEHKRKTMLDYPGCKLWSSTEIQEKLRKRIKTQHWEWFMGELGEMNQALEELHQMLPVNKVSS
jgi:hypothetical protein